MTAPVVRTLLRYLSWLWWVAGGVAAVFVLIGFVLYHSDLLDMSMWESAGNPARAMPFVLGVMATPLLLPLLVAQGITRRRFALAASVIGVLLAAATGLYLAAGFLAEKTVYAAVDLPQDLQSPHLFDSAGQPHLVFAEHALLALAYAVGGWLIGTGYYGYGGWRGTGLLVPGILITAAVEWLLGTGWVAAVGSWLDLDPPGLPLAAATGLAVALIALGLVAGRALVHPVAIRTRRLP